MPSVKLLALLFNALPSCSLSYRIAARALFKVDVSYSCAQLSATFQVQSILLVRAITSRKPPFPISHHLTIRIPKFFQSITYSENLW